MTPELEFKIRSLPDSPGCYLMKSKGEIIYVGKAKNLKNRVRQYFHASASHTPKVRAMVEKVDDFDIVLVDGELEALILECNLIKKHMPWYNILLKDDKHYPFIRIDLREPFPAVELRREQVKDGARYFGPYVGAAAVREVLDISRMLFPIRHCTKPLKPGMKARPCLHHQVGQCLAPCAGLVDEATYGAEIKKLIHFLSGHYDDVLKELKSRMAEAAAAMNYERAAVYRDRIRAVNDLMQRQKALDVGGEDRDIIAELPVDADVLVQVMLTRGGRLISSEMFTLSRAADDEPGEVLTRFMTQYYSAENPPAPPRRIEGYDISNTQGVLSVASEVVMIDGVSARREYRHYRIRDIEGPNDFESMKQVITRRLSHGLAEKAQREREGLDPRGGKFSDLPDLILIDGGPEQVKFAQEAMRAQGLDIPMFGLAKRLDEIVLPDSDESILLDRHSEALHLIERLRDEAHRFAITHHRALRQKKGVGSKLEEIPGIGPRRRRAILTHFKTMEALRSATEDEIADVDGVTRENARAVYRYLHADDENSPSLD